MNGTPLRHTWAAAPPLHFDEQGVERGGDPARPVTLRGEPFAGGHAAHPVGEARSIHGGPGLV